MYQLYAQANRGREEAYASNLNREEGGGGGGRHGRTGGQSRGEIWEEEANCGGTLHALQTPVSSNTLEMPHLL